MEYELIAAVDMGSNSFRLQIGRVVGNQIYPLDNIKESVRLAAGLGADKILTAEAQSRGLASLQMFGERLRGFDAHAVRAVATNTLRVAKNAPEFLVQAEQALGFPIEVIAGREEARLIYLGVAHSLPVASHRRLVVDIGGGSTEFIIGRRIEPLLMESLYMGCVSYTGRFFPGGEVTGKAFREAEIAAATEIENIAHDYMALGWNEAVGSSGTAREIAEILEQNRLNPDGSLGVTRTGLERLRALLIRAGSAERLRLLGMRSDRLPVLAGGLAIMSAVFESFGIERMTYGDGALRLGVMYDLLGRFHHHDMRDATVQQFAQRYQVDVAQAARVEECATDLYRQLQPASADALECDEDLQFLLWACQVHEIGISIAHSAYHKHGAYILSFADMPGFSKKEQARLALLVLGHRGKLEKLATVPPADHLWNSVFCLRTAALFCRARREAIPGLRAARQADGFLLKLPSGWLAKHPMTATALEAEIKSWQGAGLTLSIGKYQEKTKG